ncbi:MAG: hypothetical protein RLZZ488_243 [Pseudomonadota bacterium]|jgi:hypothetical protein
MFVRLFLILSAALLIIFAVSRLWRSRSSQSPATQTEVQEHIVKKREKISWRKKSLVMVNRSEFQELQTTIHRGELWLLKQTTKRGDQCMYGLFRAERVDQHNVFFKAMEKRKQSRLKTWAEAQNIEVDWQWYPISLRKDGVQQSQYCSQWMLVRQADAHLRQVIHSDRYFLSSVHYSDVTAGTPAEIKIEVDHFRRGWWIAPKKGVVRSFVVLRDSRSGLSQKVLMEFHATHGRRKTRSKTTADGVTFKSFTLPGWD